MASEAIALTIVGAGTGLAAVIDLRTRRIPNLLTAGLAVVGLALAASELGPVGLGGALVGCALGLAFVLPGQAFGRTGAGDVKLVAAACALLGPSTTMLAFLFTALIGGVLTVAIAIRQRRPLPTLRATSSLIGRAKTRRASGDPVATDNRFAYAPVIAVGVVASMLLSL